MTKTAVTYIRLTDEERERLRTRADTEQRTLSNVIRRAIRQYLQDDAGEMVSIRVTPGESLAMDLFRERREADPEFHKGMMALSILGNRYPAIRRATLAAVDAYEQLLAGGDRHPQEKSTAGAGQTQGRRKSSRKGKG